MQTNTWVVAPEAFTSCKGFSLPVLLLVLPRATVVVQHLLCPHRWEKFLLPVLEGWLFAPLCVLMLLWETSGTRQQLCWVWELGSNTLHLLPVMLLLPVLGWEQEPDVLGLAVLCLSLCNMEATCRQRHHRRCWRFRSASPAPAVSEYGSLLSPFPTSAVTPGVLAMANPGPHDNASPTDDVSGSKGSWEMLQAASGLPQENEHDDMAPIWPQALAVGL